MRCRICLAVVTVLLACGASALGQIPANAPYSMSISKLPAGHQDGVGADPTDWIKFADPHGVFNQENGITDGEAAVFSSDSQLIVTCSKSDGRVNKYSFAHDANNRATAHVSLWNAATGEMIWDRERSRAAGHDSKYRPNDQPSDGEDEVEIAIFSPDDLYVAAGGEDDKIEIWRIKNPTTGAVLSNPVLVKTLETDRAVDGMTYSHSGDLLLAGTEHHGDLEVFVVQGDPSGWSSNPIAQFRHNDNNNNSGWAINSVDITQDDQYVATQGTNRQGVFWDLQVTRDGDGLITDVDMTRIATLGDTSDFAGSGREARFSNDGGPDGSGEMYLILTNEKDYLTRVYKVEDLKNYTGGQNDQDQVPQPFRRLKNGDNSPGTLPAFGTEVEPADFAKSGRFFVNDGDSRDPGGNPNGLVFPGFLRIYETAEWENNPAGEEPDPIWVERALSTEYLNFNHDDTRLASGHGDGTLRVWDVTITDARTIESEGFNENTASHNRWTLTGSRSTPDDNEWGTSSQVRQNDAVFVGDRGTQYIGVDNLNGETHSLTMNDAWDISGFTHRQVQFAAAAAPGAFETGDFLRLLADLDGDDSFETTLAEFVPDGDQDLAWNGRKLNRLFRDDAGNDFYAFQDFFIDLAALLPDDFGGDIRFRIEANTDDSDEEIGFDSLRVTGVPEPATMSLLLGGGLMLSRRKRR